MDSDRRKYYEEISKGNDADINLLDHISQGF